MELSWKLLVALDDGVAELGAVDVHVVEEALEIVLGFRANGRALDVLKHLGEQLVEVLPVLRQAHAVFVDALEDVAKELARENEEPFLLDGLFATPFGLLVWHGGVVEGGIAFLIGEIGTKVLRDETVEQGAQDVLLEVPAIDAAAQVISDGPDGPVQLSALLFLGGVGHATSPSQY